METFNRTYRDIPQAVVSVHIVLAAIEPRLAYDAEVRARLGAR